MSSDWTVLKFMVSRFTNSQLKMKKSFLFCLYWCSQRFKSSFARVTGHTVALFHFRCKHQLWSLFRWSSLLKPGTNKTLIVDIRTARLVLNVPDDDTRRFFMIKTWLTEQLLLRKSQHQVLKCKRDNAVCSENHILFWSSLLFSFIFN